MRGVAGIARAKDLRGTQRVTALHERADMRIRRAHSLAIENVDVEGFAQTMTRPRRVLAAGDLGHAERMAVTQRKHAAEHWHLKVNAAAGRGAITAALSFLTLRGVNDFLIRVGAIRVA
jgi:hypothetical protein